MLNDADLLIKEVLDETNPNRALEQNSITKKHISMSLLKQDDRNVQEGKTFY